MRFWSILSLEQLLLVFWQRTHARARTEVTKWLASSVSPGEIPVRSRRGR